MPERRISPPDEKVPERRQGRDRRTGNPIHRMVHELEAEPELPPDGEQWDRWTTLANQEPHASRVEAAFKRTYPTQEQQDNYQGYDEEWRPFLAELHKDFHPATHTHSTAAQGAVTHVNKHGTSLKTADIMDRLRERGEL